MMKKTLVKTIELDNTQTLELFDCSRKISLDAYCVVMEASMTVGLERELFSEEDLRETSFDELLATVGPHAVYEYRAERNFIMEPEKDEVFDALVETFFNTVEPKPQRASRRLSGMGLKQKRKP